MKNLELLEEIINGIELDPEMESEVQMIADFEENM